jgi:hypothetical protein
MESVSPTKQAGSDQVDTTTPAGFQSIKDNFLAQLKSVLPDNTLSPTKLSRGVAASGGGGHSS